MTQIIVYTTQVCPKCNKLKEILKTHNIEYQESDMTSPDALTELRVNGVFSVTAPVLQVDNKFYTHEELFHGNAVKKEIIDELAEL
ncbi:glutaredoxin family protein [Methanosalsum natronophilum]|uniref:NrdH-redoxin n=1 Tax=Methanosalsum natronophilum TaxID=768733 RepID=A0A424YPI2_9EURY|nr:glutaredoxin domain-containing protein [Methanosalsum natronophilum]MCS3923742.1 glutaredoxin [Methanosalsum natronophilum]RQD80921.1 MAG: NrdH-redoxin [Methanosalsum natronophilum]